MQSIAAADSKYSSACIRTMVYVKELPGGAKGAAFIKQPGATPQDRLTAKPRALKARFIPAPILIGIDGEQIR
jgi:hypothetical protein